MSDKLNYCTVLYLANIGFVANILDKYYLKRTTFKRTTQALLYLAVIAIY